MREIAWLTAAAPILAFAIIIFFGTKLRSWAAYITVFAVGFGFVLSALIAGEIIRLGPEATALRVSFPWAMTGGEWLNMGFTVDNLTIVMLLVVTTVSLLVQIYSIGYMQGDPRYPRFFAYMALFTAAMLGLVLANNMLLLYMCWELVGVCSYFLIGFWFERPAAMRAAKKAFVVTRVGDVGLFLGLLLLFKYTGSLDFHVIFAKSPELAGISLLTIGKFALPVTAVAGILMFWGAVGKSAQFPLHVWLPDAMEGPTPVSALIHAATMVAAGVYLVARMYPVFHAGGGEALTVVAVIGAITAVMAATIGTVLNDIKRVLAYSTISQLGYMMMGLGLGGYTAGMFHLMTHAFFKANLFLGSGSVIHGTGTQDIREMGGLRKHMPWTFWTFLIATLSLAGAPGFAGFFSKDEILLTAFHANRWIFYAGAFGAFLTAFYMSRLCFLTFGGEPKNRDIHPHESPKVMTGPLIILALLSIVAGYAGFPGRNRFAEYVSFGGIAEHHFSWLVAGISTAVAALGFLVATFVYWKPVLSPAKLAPMFGWLYKFLFNKWYFDEIYWLFIVRPVLFISRACGVFDNRVVDGAVNGVGYFTVGFSILQGWIDKWIVDGAVNAVGIVTKSGGRALRLVQTGIIQQYALIMAASLLVLLLVYILR